jgi:hypothetical protein
MTKKEILDNLGYLSRLYEIPKMEIRDFVNSGQSNLEAFVKQYKKEKEEKMLQATEQIKRNSEWGWTISTLAKECNQSMEYIRSILNKLHISISHPLVEEKVKDWLKNKHIVENCPIVSVAVASVKYNKHDKDFIDTFCKYHGIVPNKFIGWLKEYGLSEDDPELESKWITFKQYKNTMRWDIKDAATKYKVSTQQIRDWLGNHCMTVYTPDAAERWDKSFKKRFSNIIIEDNTPIYLSITPYTKVNADLISIKQRSKPIGKHRGKGSSGVIEKLAKEYNVSPMSIRTWASEYKCSVFDPTFPEKFHAWYSLKTWVFDEKTGSRIAKCNRISKTQSIEDTTIMAQPAITKVTLENTIVQEPVQEQVTFTMPNTLEEMQKLFKAVVIDKTLEFVGIIEQAPLLAFKPTK